MHNDNLQKSVDIGAKMTKIARKQYCCCKNAKSMIPFSERDPANSNLKSIKWGKNSELTGFKKV